MGKKEKPKHSNKPNSQYAPCHICESTDFQWGKLWGTEFFLRDGAELFERGKRLQARKCIICGNVQLFTKEDEV
jgi:hypothetical protein